MEDSINGPGGFTLIELMIVILIIAILVAIAVPVYLNARANAQKRTCQSNLRTVDGAIQTYQSMFEPPTWPDSLNAMTDAGGGKCLKSIPCCPGGNLTPSTYAWVAGNTATNTPPELSCPYASNHRI
ncbi:MAG TPA: prepilin-type N-terminal cleavage/methylation domain-containing protein [Candidatus Anoxymicrobiaceae bacterium]